MEAHASTGYSSKKVESKFGLRILGKMGWKEYKYKINRLYYIKFKKYFLFLIHICIKY